MVEIKKRRPNKPLVVLDAPFEENNARHGSVTIKEDGSALWSIPEGVSAFLEYGGKKSDCEKELVLIFDGSKFTLRSIAGELVARQRLDVEEDEIQLEDANDDAGSGVVPIQQNGIVFDTDLMEDFRFGESNDAFTNTLIP